MGELKIFGTRRYGGAEKSLQERVASFDRLGMREDFGGTKKAPHPEPVEGRTLLIPLSCRRFA
jgi:hypothetical protein